MLIEILTWTFHQSFERGSVRNGILITNYTSWWGIFSQCCFGDWIISTQTTTTTKCVIAVANISITLSIYFRYQRPGLKGRGYRSAGYTRVDIFKQWPSQSNGPPETSTFSVHHKESKSWTKLHEWTISASFDKAIRRSFISRRTFYVYNRGHLMSPLCWRTANWLMVILTDWWTAKQHHHRYQENMVALTDW